MAADEEADAERRRAGYRRARRERAWALTQSAKAAARDGDCATVRKLEAQVRATDAEFHDQVFIRDRAFIRDVGIAACLPEPTVHPDAPP